MTTISIFKKKKEINSKDLKEKLSRIAFDNHISKQTYHVIHTLNAQTNNYPRRNIHLSRNILKK